MKELKPLVGVAKQNWSYKLVSLFVAMVLWLSVMGRKDAALTRELEIDYLLTERQSLNESVIRQATLKVKGPRVALKKFSQETEKLALDLSTREEGRQKIDLRKADLNLPLGVKLISIEPPVVTISIQMSEEE